MLMNMNASCTSDIDQQLGMLKKGIFCASELVTSFLDKIEEGKEINAFITICEEKARRQAKQSDERIAKGTARRLEGIPIAVKDNYCTDGILTTAGSKMLGNFVPTYESFVTQRLLDEGAVIVGKTNMDEFAMGSSTESSYFGPTLNPVARRLGTSTRVPGGSSGGSAAAVSGNMAVAAIGTDTGGSVRQPASFCGVIGFKPTYGVCSRWGIVAYASSLDQAGVFAKSVKDVAILMDVISGFDRNDTTSLKIEPLNFEKQLDADPRKIKIGVPTEAIAGGSTEDTDKIWDAIEKISRYMNAEMVEVSIPRFKASLAAYYVIALSEASSNLARYDGVRYGYRTPNPTDITQLYELSRSEGFGEEVQRRVMMGTYSLSAGFYDQYYNRARKIRNLLVQDFNRVFSEVDVMMMPTAPSAAFEVNSKGNNPIEMYLEDLFTVPVNMAGLPAISIPVTSNSEGMPLGLQVMGPQLSDSQVLRIASSVELAAAILDLH